MDPSSLLPHVDELVMEYLLFRGFTKSFQAFSADRKRDRIRGFDVEQIVSQLLLAIQTYQIESVLETWKFLTARFFNHLDASYALTLQQLEASLLRLYVVNAVKSGHREKVVEFFQLHADTLNASVAAIGGEGPDSWSRWFILPYIEHPECDPYFQVFFGQAWLAAFVTSFRNFLSLVFRNLPLPKLLAFQLARLEEPTLKLRLKVSQSEATRLRLYNSEATAKIKKLEEAGRQLHSILRMLVQHSMMEHFSPSGGVNMTTDRNKSKDHSNSYDAASSVGLSQKQMKDLWELFGIITEDSSHVNFAPVDPRDIPRVAEVYLPIDELSEEVPARDDEEDKKIADAPRHANEADNDLMAPMFSPIATSPSPLAEDEHNDQPSPQWSSDASDKLTYNIQASLIREINMLNDWEPTKSVMTARSRFSADGQFLAIAKLGNTHIDIWNANPVAFSLISTINLPTKLTGLSWLGPRPNKQLLACTLEGGNMMLWDADGQDRIACPSNENDMQAQQLICAREAPIAACLLTSRDVEENVVQQVLVLHGGMDEPLQDYFSMEKKQLTCLAWNNVGNVLITGSSTGNIEFINVIRPERIHRCNLVSCSGSARMKDGNLAAICLSPDETSMLSVYETSSVVMEWSVTPIMVAVAFQSDTSSDARGSILEMKPTLACTYAMDKPLAPRDDEVDTSIRFVGAGDYFVVADSAALHIFKRSEERAILTFLPNQATIADLDCHPNLPMSCSANQKGVISLWNMKGYEVCRPK